jgi:hypothetical protein
VKAITITFLILIGSVAFGTGCRDLPKGEASHAGITCNTEHRESIDQIKQLCPIGMKATEAVDKLGPGSLACYYGPTVSSSIQQSNNLVADKEYWALEYQTTNGTACLWLSWPSINTSNLDEAIISGVTKKSTFKMKQ